MSFQRVEVHELTYDVLIKEISSENVKEIVITPHSNEGTYTITGTLNSYKENETFRATVPYSESVMNGLLNTSTASVLLVGVVPLLLKPYVFISLIMNISGLIHR